MQYLNDHLNQVNYRNPFVMTIERLQRVAPSIFAGEPWANVGDNYRFVRTADVMETLVANQFYPVMASQNAVRMKNISKTNYVRHLIRFRHRDNFAMQQHDGEIPEIVLMNSHDGSSTFRLMIGIFRVVCSNGLIVAAEDYGRMVVRHAGDENVPRKVLRMAHDLIGVAPTVLQQVSYWKKIKLTYQQQMVFAKNALAEFDSAMADIPVSHLLLARRQQDNAINEQQERDLWTTMNVVQEKFIKGGVGGRTIKGCWRKTSAIKSIDRNIKLNKQLWRIAEETAKLAA